MALASQVEMSLSALSQLEDDLVAHSSYLVHERLWNVAVPFSVQPTVEFIDGKTNPRDGGARNYFHHLRAQ
jgi:hypothetical protein